MLNRKFFFDTVRQSLFDGKLSGPQVQGLSAHLDEWEAICGEKDDRHFAYILATTHHETDRKIQPIHEYGNAAYFNKRYGPGTRVGKQLGNTQPGDGAKYAGRGYVQLTGKANYLKAGTKLGIDLLRYPEKALEVKAATQILFTGMKEGWFTGKKLSHYFNATKEDWVNARRIINGLDKANLVAGYAKKYYAAISH